MEPELPLALRLPPAGSRQLLREVHAQLRAAILDGRLQPGLRMPATRAFAAQFDIGRNTAIAAYDLLLAEGYLRAHERSGTFVADTLRAPRRRTARADRQDDSRLAAAWRGAGSLFPQAPVLRCDFRVGVPDPNRFPFAVWRRLTARALRTGAKAPLAYGDPQGSPPLRAAIAQHASFARAVACAADDVVVTAGAQQAFDLLARILVTPGRTLVALENPGYPPARAAFAAAGAQLVDVPVDEEGVVVERIPSNARVIYVTPSHQFPLGCCLSMRRRAALLEYARKHGATVIEDDYDGEFRFGERPLDALQTLDRTESVCYVGTFSKSVFPAMRLGYVVAPPWARRALVQAKQIGDWHCATLTQDTLAAFIAEGHLARHVRQLRSVYAARREALLEGLHEHFGELLLPVPSSAGLHLTALTASASAIDALVERARARDLGLNALRPYWRGRAARAGLVFGYGAIEEKSIREGMEVLRRLWRR